MYPICQPASQGFEVDWLSLKLELIKRHSKSITLDIMGPGNRDNFFPKKKHLGP